MIHEENLDDEETKGDNDKALIAAFPKVPNLDTGNPHKSNEDLWQEKAIIDEILKKRP